MMKPPLPIVSDQINADERGLLNQYLYHHFVVVMISMTFELYCFYTFELWKKMSETQQRTELQRVLEEQKPYLSLPSSSIELFEYSMQHRYIDIERRV